MPDFKDLPSRFDHAEAAPRIYAQWEASGAFHSEPDPERIKHPLGPFTIVIPPPNVTGALHLGHALNNTLQDIVVRMKRMQGYCALWMPGTDHAGIATQAMVEKRIWAEEKKTRRDLGREKLVERIWEWKHEYEARILGQLKRMGASCDWARTRFTLDETCARAVRETFFRMFREGYIYRGKRLVNWDTKLLTSVADDETYTEETKGGFWTFKYPVVEEGRQTGEFIRFSTTRPETMLGDTAVCVHPSDERYQPLIGRKVLIPLVNREIPIIADALLADPTLGTGCVKVTPAHDANDYACWQRNPHIGIINILHPDGTINENGGQYAGQDRYKAREAIVAQMESLGLFEGREDRVIPLKFSDRSKSPIEPYLSDQWFVRMADRDDGKPGLAEMTMEALTNGRVKIVPERYARSYLDWLGEKRDWCISRQLWWGHRIPIWSRMRELTAEERKKFKELGRDLAEFEAEYPGPSLPADTAGIRKFLHDSTRFKIHETESKYGDRVKSSIRPDLATGNMLELVCVKSGCEDVERDLEANGYEQDPDVLDTWFSSALWPHSTLGWPEKTPELAYYYPTSTLITSRDIITLWVARMVLTGLFNLGDVPFREVYIHPKILDGYGEGMSKSKGNGVDPLDIIEKFGPDALRFGLAYLTTETQDVRMPVQFECPHCQELIEQTKKNRELPRVQCSKCGQPFATQWARSDEDKALKRGAVVSERFEVSRNFVNKLWNAARLTLMNLGGYEPGLVREDEPTVEDRWILSQLATVTGEVTRSLETYAYGEASRALYDFTWRDFCDYYAEMVKPRMADPAQRPLAQRVLAHTFDTLLRLLHPIIPFVTEEIWSLLNQAAPKRGLPLADTAARELITAPWPKPDADRQNPQIERQFAQFQALLGALREIRSRQNITPKTSMTFHVQTDAATIDLLKPLQPYLEKMANAKAAAWGASITPPATHAKTSLPGLEVYVDLAGLIDVAAEIARNEKELERLTKAIEGKKAKLANENFVARAPADVIAKEREQLGQYQEQAESARAALEALLRQRGLGPK